MQSTIDLLRHVELYHGAHRINSRTSTQIIQLAINSLRHVKQYHDRSTSTSQDDILDLRIRYVCTLQDTKHNRSFYSE